MGGTTPAIDYDALAQQHGATIDYDALASQHGGSAGDAARAPETGIWAGVKRNTVGAINGLFHAFSDPATDAEKEEIKKKFTNDYKGEDVPASTWENPSQIALAYHRLVDAPADQLAAKGKSEQEAAKDLLAKRDTWKGANLYASGAVDRGLAAVPMLGPFVNSIAQRAESGDVSGAATDVAAALAAPHIAKAAGNLVRGAGDVVAAAKPGIVSELNKTDSVAGRIAKVAADKLLPDSDASVAQRQLANDAAEMRARNLRARIAESKAAEAAGQTITEYRAAQKAAAKAAQAPPPTPEPSPIVPPQAPPSEGRPATWRDFTGGGKIGVADLASGGGPLAFDAATQAKLRQLDVPNVGLVADPRATVAPTLNTPKSVTLFDAQGNPIPAGGVSQMADLLGGNKPEPQYLYRIRPVGEKGVPKAAENSPAQLTSSLEQAQSWLDGKNMDKPHEIIRVPVSSLKPGQTTARPFSEGIEWHKVHQAIPESDVEVVVPHPEAVGSE